jgi:hypothetical protein
MSGWSIRPRAPKGTVRSDGIQRDPDVLSGFLEDAAHHPADFRRPVIATSEAASAGSFRDRAVCASARSRRSPAAHAHGRVLLTTSRLNKIVKINAESVRVGAGLH